MNHSDDAHWQNLIALSAPAFPDAADVAPPYGFTTRLLARLRSDARQRETMERIGMRALFASLAILLLTAAVTFGVNRENRSDFEPGLRGILQVANVPLFLMPLVPSRKIAAAFLGVFLVGIAVGALLIWAFQDASLSRFMTNTSDPKSMAARINQKYLRDYHLSPDEQARIAPLTAEMAQQLYQTRRQFGVDIIATLDDYHRKIGEQMTPEHRQAFEETNAARKKRMSAMLLLEPAPAANSEGH